MKKFLTVWGLLLFISITSYSQEKKYALYSVAFYNLENLFDTIHDAGKNDFEYLPNGKNKWNSMKYEAKLKNMSEILSQLSTDKLPLGPTIIGMWKLKTEEYWKIYSNNLLYPTEDTKLFIMKVRTGVVWTVHFSTIRNSFTSLPANSLHIFMRIMILPIKPVVSLLPAVHLPVKRCTLS